MKRLFTLKNGLLLLAASILIAAALWVNRKKVISLWNRLRHKYVQANAACACNKQNLPSVQPDYYRVIIPELNKHYKKFYLKDEKTYKRFLRDGVIMELNDTEFFRVDAFSTSSPGLHPGACKLLTELGQRFQSALKAEGIMEGWFHVHSGSRTENQQRETKQNNPHTASDIPSAHSFCVAVDISKIKVSGNNCKAGMECFQKVLNAMRKEGKLRTTPESTNLHLTFYPERSSY
jgi:hypothetical protein